MNKLGLYVVDSSEDCNLQGYSETNKKWVRSRLMFNGQLIHKTAKQINNLGVYFDGNTLKLNGSPIATKTEEGDVIEDIQNDAFFADIKLSGQKRCINITLENYNKLRSGFEVEGYARYSPKVVYNIVEAANVTDTPPEVDMSKFSGDNYIHNEFDTHNELTNQTVLSIDTPDIVVKTTEFIITEGDTLSLEYWVDNKQHTATSVQMVDDKQRLSVGDKFTVLIKSPLAEFENNDGIILQRTTYAGEYKAELGPFNTPGKTYISVQCIDEQGRGSVEYFYDVLVKENTEERLYEVSQGDLDDYGIVPLTIEDDDIARENLVQGYHNKRGLELLIKNISNNVSINGTPLENGPYTGIKLFNANPNPTNLYDKRNTVYYIDCHKNKTSYNSYDGTDATVDLSRFTRYYLVYFKLNSDKKSGKLGILNSSGKFVDIINSSSDNAALSYNYPTLGGSDGDFENYRLTPGKTVSLYINKVLTENTIPNEAPEKYQDVWEDCDIVFNWIRRDGAHIYRDENNKIKVPFRADLEDDEVYSGNRAYVRSLRIRSVEAIKKYKDELSFVFPEGDGYYYLAMANTDVSLSYREPGLPIAEYLCLPDNFTIDFNYTTWKTTNCSELYKYKVLSLCDNINTTLLNGRVLSDMTPKHTQDALIRTCFMETCWEGAGSVILSGAEFCVIRNFDVGNVGGYNSVCGTVADFATGLSENIVSRLDASCSGVVTHISYQSIGYISLVGNNAGEFVVNDNNNSCIIKDEQGHSVLPDYSSKFTATDMANRIYRDANRTDVCLITNASWNYTDEEIVDEYIPLTAISYTYYVKKYGVTKRIDLTPWEFGFQLSNYKGAFTKCVSGGKYHEVFIHFYKPVMSPGAQAYQYISSVKTSQYAKKIYPPKGATHFRITGYGDCIDLTDSRATSCLNAIEIPSNKIQIGNAVLAFRETGKDVEFYVPCVDWQNPDNEKTSLIRMKAVEGNIHDDDYFRVGGSSKTDTDGYKVKVKSFLIGEMCIGWQTYRAVLYGRWANNYDYVQRGITVDKWLEFLDALNELNLSDVPFRLPTEAEWEYAARGGRNASYDLYAGGDDLGNKEIYQNDHNCGVGWYVGNSKTEKQGYNFHLMKKKKKNSLGIYDMSGNAYELCSDYYDDLPTTDDTLENYEQTVETQDGRVLKGGCYISSAEDCEVTARTYLGTTHETTYEGDEESSEFTLTKDYVTLRLAMDDVIYRDEEFMSMFAFRIRKVTTGCIFDNYIVHDTKSIALNGPSVNCTYKNSFFYNIQTIDDLLNITPLLSDVEENCILADGTTYNNCVVLGGKTYVDANCNEEDIDVVLDKELINRGIYGHILPLPEYYGKSKSLLGNPLGQHRLFVKNCTGLGVTASVNRSIIEDSKMSRLHATFYPWFDNEYHPIFRRLQVCEKYADRSNGGFVCVGREHYKGNKFFLTGTPRNTCDVPATIEVTLEDVSFELMSMFEDSAPSSFYLTRRGTYNDARNASSSVTPEGIVEQYVPLNEQE